jgi:hypothetical protein
MEKNVDKTTIRTTGYDGSKDTEGCGIFQSFGLLAAIFTGEIDVGFPCQKQDLTRRRRFLAANLT